jgi:hypothetical protein
MLVLTWFLNVLWYYKKNMLVTLLLHPILKQTGIYENAKQTFQLIECTVISVTYNHSWTTSYQLHFYEPFPTQLHARHSLAIQRAATSHSIICALAYHYPSLHSNVKHYLILFTQWYILPLLLLLLSPGLLWLASSWTLICCRYRWVHMSPIPFWTRVLVFKFSSHMWLRSSHGALACVRASVFWMGERGVTACIFGKVLWLFY